MYLPHSITSFFGLLPMREGGEQTGGKSMHGNEGKSELIPVLQARRALLPAPPTAIEPMVKRIFAYLLQNFFTSE